MEHMQQTTSPESRQNTARIRSRIKLTWEGVFWLLLAAVLLTQGWYRNIGLLAFLAFFLFALFLLQAAYILWWRRGLRRMQVVRRLPETIFANESFFVELELENPGRRQLALRIEDCCDEGELRWYVPVLQGGKKIVLRQRTMLRQRGRHRWSAIRISTGFPFGLLRRVVIVESQTERIVYPAVGQINMSHLESVLELSPPQSLHARPWHRPLPGAEFEFHGLREYRSGDSPRYVHWRSSARAGKLLVREMEPPNTDQVVIVLDAWRPSTREAQGDGPDIYRPLEDAICLAATVIEAVNREPGRQVVLVIWDSQLSYSVAQTGTSHFWSLLKNLALVRGASDLFPTNWTSYLPSPWARSATVWVTSRPDTSVVSNSLSSVTWLANVHDPSVLSWYNPPQGRPLACLSSREYTV